VELNVKGPFPSKCQSCRYEYQKKKERLWSHETKGGRKEGLNFSWARIRLDGQRGDDDVTTDGSEDRSKAFCNRAKKKKSRKRAKEKRRGRGEKQQPTGLRTRSTKPGQ